MECNKCLLTSDIAEVNGDCEFCKTHDKLTSEANPFKLRRILEKVKRRKGFQVLLGVSGGVDSCYLIHWALNMGLRPLVVHFDNGYNNEIAEENIRKLTKDVTFMRVSLPQSEYDLLNEAFIYAGVPDADIPNDMAMTAIMMDIADKYGIKYIFNGHDFKSEGSTPLKWTYMDAKYIKSVYRWYTGIELVHFPHYTFKKQLKYALKGIKQIRPYYHMDITDSEKKEELREYGWEDYGVKHGENLYTEWVGYDYLPNNFGIDKRRVYLSAQIRSGLITKEQAKEELKKTHKVKKVYNEFAGVKRTHKDFETYNFKKYRFLLWVLANMKLVPYLFYKKYTK